MEPLRLPRAALAEISGQFVKIVPADGLAHVLGRGSPSRPPARFNRPGQDALYLSPDATSAMVAIGQYIRPGEPDRLLVEYELSPCTVLDLRHEADAALYDEARLPWLPALAEGAEPASWRISDFLRGEALAGLIDPSRRRPGLWALTLFGWNSPGAPTLELSAPPRPIAVPPDFR